MSLPFRPLLLSTLLTAALAVTLVAAALPAAAQDEGCTQSRPCEWIIDFDESGFLDSVDYTGSVGDWLVVNATSFGDVDHTLTLDAYSVSLHIPADGDGHSAPFQLKQGTYTLKDSPSGKGLTLTVVNCDPQDYADGLCDANGNTGGSTSPAGGAGAGSTNSAKRQPGVSVIATLAGMGVLVVLLRRLK